MCTGTTGKNTCIRSCADIPWLHQRMSLACRNQVMVGSKASKDCSIRQKAASAASEQGVKHLP